MDKEEILKRGREDGPDEREQKIYLDALNFSGIIVCLICIFFICYSIIKGVSPYLYCIMAMAYCASDKLYRFAKLKRKNDLIFGLAASASLICWIVLFILDF